MPTLQLFVARADRLDTVLRLTVDGARELVLRVAGIDGRDRVVKVTTDERR